jgi:hypothetical protein
MVIVTTLVTPMLLKWSLNNSETAQNESRLLADVFIEASE